MDDYSVPIPARVKTRMEIVEGIGIPEMCATGIAAVIGAFIAYTLNALTSNILLALIIFAIIAGGTFLSVMKDKNNQCIAGIFKNMILFYASQRKFYFEVIEEVEFYNSYLRQLEEKGVFIK